MAKTIRSHPTSPFVLPEPVFWTTFTFPKFDPEMDLPLVHFPQQRPAPQGKRMRMDHPFILCFCQNVTFDIVFTIIFSLFGQNLLS